MRYYKLVSNGYLESVGIGASGVEITETEYAAILTAIDNKPAATETIDYQLRDDLTWEPFDIEAVEDDIDEAEAYEIIFGGAE